MQRRITPIPCKPWTLNGLSDRLIVRHYENNYGAAVRSVNSIQSRLAELDPTSAPVYEIRALKQAELSAMGSVALHELYFGSLGGDGAVLAVDDSQAMLDAAPLLALDMYEHAYQMEFGANATAYIDAFMRNVDWTAVDNRLTHATSAQESPRVYEAPAG